MFSQACVILFTGGCLPQCMLGYTPLSRHPPEQTPPLSRHPPGSRHPPEQTSPREQTPPWSRPPGADTPWSRCPPEQTPPQDHAGRYGQRAGGTHPTGMQSCVENVCTHAQCLGLQFIYPPANVGLRNGLLGEK